MSVQVVPPTINALLPQQRIRLIKSTRKLGNILGTTPQMVEDGLLRGNSNAPSDPFGSSSSCTLTFDDEPPQTAKPAISFCLVPESQSASRQQAMANRHPTLALMSVDPDSTASSSRRASVTSMISPISFSSAQRSPLSPTFSFNADIPARDICRKRMHKLTRTLGENIPPELVFPHLAQEVSVPSVWTDSEAMSRRRSWSIGTASSNTALLQNVEQHSSRAGRATPASSVDLRHEDDQRRESLAFSRTCSPIPQDIRSGFMHMGADLERTYSSSSENSLRSLPFMPQKREASLGHAVSRSASTRTSGRNRSNTIGKQKARKEEGLLRKEHEWEGQWNRQDMDEVVSKLRNLRTK